MEHRHGARREARVAGNGGPSESGDPGCSGEKDQAKGGVRVDRHRSPFSRPRYRRGPGPGKPGNQGRGQPRWTGPEVPLVHKIGGGHRESQERRGDRIHPGVVGASFRWRSVPASFRLKFDHPRGWADKRSRYGRESGEGRATVRSELARRPGPDGASEPMRRPVRIHEEKSAGFHLIDRVDGGGAGGCGTSSTTARKYEMERCPRNRTPTSGNRRRRARRARLNSTGLGTGRKVGEGAREAGAVDGRSLRTAESKEAGVQTSDSEHGGHLASMVLEIAARLPRERADRRASRWGDPPEGKG